MIKKCISKGGRYKIIREEKKGAVDTNLIIKNINYKDNFARYKYRSEYRQMQYTDFEMFSHIFFNFQVQVYRQKFIGYIWEDYYGSYNR